MRICPIGFKKNQKTGNNRTKNSHLETIWNLHVKDKSVYILSQLMPRSISAPKEQERRVSGKLTDLRIDGSSHPAPTNGVQILFQGHAKIG